ncbi:MAG: hypothetical protein ACT4QE_13490 [Anaerolineales bacterium]
MESNSDARRVVMIVGGIVLGLIVLCGVCGTLLLVASFFFAGS